MIFYCYKMTIAQAVSRIHENSIKRQLSIEIRGRDAQIKDISPFYASHPSPKLVQIPFRSLKEKESGRELKLGLWHAHSSDEPRNIFH